ncbi:MAG: VOC family protein [Deltaproteobacteria bacterium]|nr:VOC family protein [Deltaproteobacteria bacterium]
MIPAMEGPDTATAPGILGLRHVALRVADVARSRAFYERTFGMRATWEPDPENLYLTTGTDVLALHRGDPGAPGAGALDHIGFLVDSDESVDRIAMAAAAAGDRVAKAPRRHRDDSYSAYLEDPDGNLVQVIHVPGLPAVRG